VKNIEVGDIAPEFELADNNGSTWSLSAMKGNVVVLLFYPQNETLVCNRQLCSVRDRWQDYLDTKAVVVGISPAEPASHTAFADKYYLPIPLLADEGRRITSQFVKHHIFPISFTRGIVIIDAVGRIREREIMLRAFRPSDDSLIAAIHAARHDALMDQYGSLRQRIKRVII
jgi:Peroxiredoxin